MKILHLASSLLLLLALPSCDKAKDLLSKVKAAVPKPAASAAASSGSAPGGASKRPADFRMIEDLVSYDEFTSRQGPLIVTHFHWKDCQYSQSTCKVLDILGSEYAGRAQIGRVDKDESPEITNREGVDSYPRLRFYRDGKMVEEIPGFMVVSDLRQIFEKHIQGIPATAVPPPAETPAAPAEPAIQPMKKDWRPPGIERR